MTKTPCINPPKSDKNQAPGNDRIVGNSSNNEFHGNDLVFGGGGKDVAAYGFTRIVGVADLRSDGSVVIQKSAGMDTLYGVERVEFSNGTLVYDIVSDNLGLGYRIYQAAFGRTPDEGGVRFWIDVLDTLDDWGWSKRAKELYVAEEFNQSSEFQSLYGTNPSNLDYIDAMYQNVLYRLPDQGGYDFWIGSMAAGLSREDILIYFAESPENIANNVSNLNDGVWVA